LEAALESAVEHVRADRVADERLAAPVDLGAEEMHPDDAGLGDDEPVEGLVPRRAALREVLAQDPARDLPQREEAGFRRTGGLEAGRPELRDEIRETASVQVPKGAQRLSRGGQVREELAV